MLADLPRRAHAGLRPRLVPMRTGRPLKRWRYVGVYGPELMVCAGLVRVAGVPQSFWAVWDRATGTLHERTRPGHGGLELSDDGARVAAGDVHVALALEPAGEPVEVLSPHGAAPIWTRKLPVRARGTVTLGSRRVALEAAGLIDESAGWHARETAWSWSAGVGTSAAGEPVAWNLVDGVHDAPQASERTIWVAGHEREAGPARFAADLGTVTAGDLDLRFTAEAERARRDRVGPFASDYRQPFGTFSGTLGDGVELAEGWGVMERHTARW
jgi:Protein of unknown function (DUF2804)